MMGKNQPEAASRTMMPTIPKTTPLLLSLLICSYQQPCSAIPRPVAGTSWQLHSIALPTGTIAADGAADGAELTPVLPDTTVTAIFGDDGSQVAGTLTGSGGCNDYFTDFEVDLATMGISFDHIGSTEMDCGEEIMEQESAYFAALDMVDSHDIFGDKLKLRDESGTMLLLFIPLVDTANLDGDTSDIVDILVGTEWTATSYLSPDTSDLVPIQPGSKVTITFESETNLKGNGGCNSYFGSYASAPYDEQPDGDGDVGGRLAIFEMGSTEMGCIDPPGRMDQEIAYFRLLQSAAEYRLRSTDNDGDDDMQTLLVLDDDGVVVLAFLPAWTLDQDQEYGISDNDIPSNEQGSGGILGSIPETVMSEDKDVNGEGTSPGGDSKLSDMGPDQADAMASTGDASSAKGKLAIASWSRNVLFFAAMIVSCIA